MMLGPSSEVLILFLKATTFLQVAIAWERYVAVHYPLDYNQAMNDANAIRKRLLKYVGPTFLLAFAFNIVKFFEAQVKYHPVNRTRAFEFEVDNSTTEVIEVSEDITEAEIEYVAELHVAELRTHPAYSAYNNWSRLIVLGIIPFTLLVFFNAKIYKDISERRKRRLR